MSARCCESYEKWKLVRDCPTCALKLFILTYYSIAQIMKFSLFLDRFPFEVMMYLSSGEKMASFGLVCLSNPLYLRVFPT